MKPVIQVLKEKLMDNQEFAIEVESAFLRSKRLLIRKEKEYSEGIDRLDQFKKVGILNNEPATKSLWGMAVKHVSSIADMVKNPTSYNLKTWREKLTDLRNYTFLLEALLKDLEV